MDLAELAAPIAAAASVVASATDHAEVCVFKVGDVVLGHAKKFKGSFNDVKCRIVGVLAQHYKVEMIDGDAAGTSHKYLHDCVTAIQEPVAESPAPEGSAAAPAVASSSKPSAGGGEQKGAAWMDFDDVFGDKK